MMVFTAKFNRRRAIISVLILAAILCAIILIAGGSGSEDKPNNSAKIGIVKSNEDRVTYLQELGWEISENAIDEQDIVIPREFTDVYEQYNKIQLEQGFDLSEYGGIEAVRYSYIVLNHPNASEGVYADIIVYNNQVIAGDVQCNMADGFMHGLNFPTE